MYVRIYYASCLCMCITLQCARRLVALLGSIRLRQLAFKVASHDLPRTSFVPAILRVRLVLLLLLLVFSLLTYIKSPACLPVSTPLPAAVNGKQDNGIST